MANNRLNAPQEAALRRLHEVVRNNQVLLRSVLPGATGMMPPVPPGPLQQFIRSLLEALEQCERDDV